MKRLLGLAARLYPARWRNRYGVEFQALLDETKPGWRDILDVLKGGLQMRLRHGHPALMVAAFSLVGAFGAGAMAFNTAARFASTGTMSVRPAVLPAASGTAWLEDLMPKLTRDAFSRSFLTDVIQKRDLYHRERAQASTDDLVSRMRGDISIQLISPSVVRVSFASADARDTQHVASDLMGQLVDANFRAGRESVVQLIDLPGEARVSVSRRRVAEAGLGGFGGGALVGTLIGWLRRRNSQPGS